MKTIIGVKTAGTIMLVLLAALAVFHVLVMLRIVPPIVWGGQAAGNDTLIVSEIISLAVTLMFMGITVLKSGIIRADRFRLPITIATWCMGVLFLFSTIGNLLSPLALERLIFTPVALILTVLAFRLARGKRYADS